MSSSLRFSSTHCALAARCTRSIAKSDDGRTLHARACQSIGSRVTGEPRAGQPLIWHDCSAPHMRLEPCALAIGGLAPSGGAGVFADLRAFAAASVWGCGAVAVVTVQSTAGLRSSYPIETKRLLEQVREIARHQHVRSV